MLEEPTSLRIDDPGVRALFTEAARFQSWLDVEAALAQAQAELGIIPEAAAREIVAQGASVVSGPRGGARGAGPHRPSAGAAGVGARSRLRGRRRRLRALGRDHPERHADRPAPPGAPGPRHLPAPARGHPDHAGRPGRAHQGRAAARAAPTASTRCPPPSASRSRCGSTSWAATSSACRAARAACSWPCWAAARARSPRWASSGLRHAGADGGAPRHAADARARAHHRRPPGRVRAAARHARGHLAARSGARSTR